MKPAVNSMNCYDYPQYWDLAFRAESRREADFFEAAFVKYCDFPVRSVFEPGCGGGRLIVEMARRGYHATGLDLSEASIEYLRRRLSRRKLRADVFTGDMTDFSLSQPADAAFCTFNTFRHLLTEDAARRHLQAVARSLRRGGIYILGFHLFPPDADEDDSERWTAQHGRTHVTMSLRVLTCDRRARRETLRFCLRVRSGRRDLRLRSDYELRLYECRDVRRLLASVPEFELCDVYDFWYDLNDPQTLDNERGDTVLILRKR